MYQSPNPPTPAQNPKASARFENVVQAREGACRPTRSEAPSEVTVSCHGRSPSSSMAVIVVDSIRSTSPSATDRSMAGRGSAAMPSSRSFATRWASAFPCSCISSAAATAPGQLTRFDSMRPRPLRMTGPPRFVRSGRRRLPEQQHQHSQPSHQGCQQRHPQEYATARPVLPRQHERLPQPS